MIDEVHYDTSFAYMSIKCFSLLYQYRVVFVLYGLYVFVMFYTSLTFRLVILLTGYNGLNTACITLDLETKIPRK